MSKAFINSYIKFMQRKYLQCWLFFPKTSTIHLIMLSINMWSTYWLMAARCCIINAWVLSEFVGFYLSTCLWRIDHMFSMGLRSGEVPGHGPKTSMNGLRMLYCRHDIGPMLALTVSPLDRLFFLLDAPYNQKGDSSEKTTLPRSSAVQSLYLLQNISLSPMFFLERRGFFTAQSLRLPLCTEALTPVCCHF